VGIIIEVVAVIVGPMGIVGASITL